MREQRTWPAVGRVDAAWAAAALCAAALAASVFFTWYAWEALVESGRYVGNFLPGVDWVVAAMAILAIGFRRWRGPAGVAGCVSTGLAWFGLYWDFAEGLEVDLGVGLPIATAASIGLLLTRRWDRGSPAQSQADSPRATPD